MTITHDGLLDRLKQGQFLQKLADERAIANEFDGVIVRLWRKGVDTVSIARYAKVRESAVANRMAVLRDTGAL